MSEENNNNQTLERFHYEQSLNRVMRLPAVCLFGLAYLAPCTIFTTYGLITVMTHGMLALAYIFATVAMLFTALSYRNMVKAYPISGSVYTYVQRSINPHIGFLSGWAILLDYLLLPMLNYIVASLYLPILIPAIPGWVWIVVMTVGVTLINLLGIKTTSIVNNILIIIQVAFVILVIITSIKYIVGGGGDGTLIDGKALFNAVEFHNPAVGMAAILGGASVLALSFLGFDSVTTIVEETIEPEKNVGRALIIICLSAGGLFIFSAYIMQIAWPDAWSALQDPNTGANEYFLNVCGSVVSLIFLSITIVGTGASAIASQASAARILFSMGRDNVLPKKFFGHISARKVPSYNLIVIGVIGLSALFINLEMASSLINFGALLGFTLVNLSVVSHYFIRKKQRTGSSIFKYLIMPLIGATVCFTIWINLSGYSKIIGFIWLGIGAVYLAATTNFFRKLPPDLNLEE